MSIIYNNKTIDSVKYNGTTLETVKYNGTEVFSGTKRLTVTKNIIKSIIINGTTYSDNTTVNIKPGTSVTLNCTLYSNTTIDSWLRTYSFVNWTGYTTETNQEFTFIMPNSNITYTANGDVTRTMDWPSSGNIPESTFLNGININGGSYDTSLVGRYVTLKESSSTHNWLIIRVNSNSYDLWYKGSIGDARWKGAGTDRYWLNNSSSSTTYVRGLCTSYKSKLSSSIQKRLKTGLNANCGDDTVVILSAKQLGCTESTIGNDDNIVISYLNGMSRRTITGIYYWTTSTYSKHSYYIWSVRGANVAGELHYNSNYNGTNGVVPAIRVG